MPAPCLFVAYASSAIRPFTREELAALLFHSRVRNASAQVTGLLLHRGGNFLQAIEGPEDAVRSTMLRITRDKRHRSIVPLHEGFNDGRLFSQWQMGYEEVGEQMEPQPGMTRFLSGEDDLPSGGHDVFEFFRAFRDHLR